MHFYLGIGLDRKILDMLPDRPPQVSFSCDNSDGTCGFEFWVAQVESFYCALDNCTSTTKIEFNKNTTSHKCEHIKCKCVPGRFLCGEDGSVGALELSTTLGCFVLSLLG